MKNKQGIRLLFTPAELRKHEDKRIDKIHCVPGEYPLCSDRKPCCDCLFVIEQNALDRDQSGV